MTLSALMLMTVISAGAAQAPASADGGVQAQVESLYAEGAALYKAGKYRPATEKFEQAYALYPEPNLLYNLGRAYEALGEIDQAMLKYRLCSTHPQAAPDVAVKAREKLAVLESAQANSVNTTNPTTGEAGRAPAATAPEAPAPTPEGFPMFGAVGTVAGLAGVGAAVAGGVLFALGASAHGSIDAAKQNPNDSGVSGLTRVEAERLAGEGTTQKTAGVILLSVGGGLALVGISLLGIELME